MTNSDLEIENKLIAALEGSDAFVLGDPHKSEYMKRLKQLLIRERENTEKAFGGCKKCYGKGYSTWRHGETYRGSTHNMRTDIKYCTCDRGKQLEAQLKQSPEVQDEKAKAPKPSPKTKGK